MQRVRGRWDQGDNRRHGQMGFVDHVRGLAAHLISRDAEEEIVSLEDHFCAGDTERQRRDQMASGTQPRMVETVVGRGCNVRAHLSSILEIKLLLSPVYQHPQGRC